MKTNPKTRRPSRRDMLIPKPGRRRNPYVRDPMRVGRIVLGPMVEDERKALTFIANNADLIETEAGPWLLVKADDVLLDTLAAVDSELADLEETGDDEPTTLQVADECEPPCEDEGAQCDDEGFRDGDFEPSDGWSHAMDASDIGLIERLGQTRAPTGARKSLERFCVTRRAAHRATFDRQRQGFLRYGAAIARAQGIEIYTGPVR